MPRLYKTADCFALASRGEGWGLPICQSMACGVPAIVPNSSAIATYANEGNSLMIDAKQVKIDNLQWLLDATLQQEHEWFEPDYKQLKNRMRWAYENRNTLPAIGAKARATIEKFTWENSALQIVKLLEKYGK